ncbi:ribonuclease activity regulator RraA [Caenimonas aquaedulcis]|uniref:Ribonuclease activity regulator RraA n=1 Tax=Caenimonas aquaedulcis TaxID=2793270 RepID=A0A931H2J3_9BURK|nr:ribonuclease activity regulator RraA [Caenimonas aquaedulcis]MBG9387373.1 ribonuclease activity regulator RraA [Caenimonas aquaedulcis]
MADIEFKEATRDLLRGVSVATLCTQLFKRGFRNVYIQGIARLTEPSGGNLVGPAFTMRNIPAREDVDQISAFDDPNHPQRKGIESVPPGHVLVIDCRGETRVASGGQILTTRLKVRGAAGLVSDGPVRDSGAISAMDFPVYCAGGSAPLNLIHHHAIDLDVPIGCGGVAVYPGDIMVGDDEGVVVIPRHLAEEVARDASEQEKMEAFILERIEGGAALPGTYPPNAQTREAFAAWRKDRGI